MALLVVYKVILEHSPYMNLCWPITIMFQQVNVLHESADIIRKPVLCESEIIHHFKSGRSAPQKTIKRAYIYTIFVCKLYTAVHYVLFTGMEDPSTLLLVLYLPS